MADKPDFDTYRFCKSVDEARRSVNSWPARKRGVLEGAAHQGLAEDQPQGQPQSLKIEAVYMEWAAYAMATPEFEEEPQVSVARAIRAAERRGADTERERIRGLLEQKYKRLSRIAGKARGWAEGYLTGLAVATTWVQPERAKEQP